VASILKRKYLSAESNNENVGNVKKPEERNDNDLTGSMA